MAVMNVTNTNFNSLINSGKPVLVEFSAPWCVYCRRLAPAVERTSEKMSDKITVAQVNIDDVPELAEKYGIDTIPALMLFKNGSHGEKLVGPPSQNAVEDWVKRQL
ncbi:thioredoxin family protein [Lachnospiraceae bacterium NSJ-143]|nr:thioredoxin family protein [Lachnospiraceae bacterium NSJ-143]